MRATYILSPSFKKMQPYSVIYMFLMRDEKEERKKQARSNKQTRQSNTAHVQYTIDTMNIQYQKNTLLSWI